jgi:hypothetical protein
MDDWQTRKILILGMTYPSYSRKYMENVCTGGLVDGSKAMIRLHPFNLRYFPEEKQPHAFQWITIATTKHSGDPRPESFRVKPDTIELLERVPPSRAAYRRSLLEESPHLCQSLEELQERQRTVGTSLGIIQPAEIIDCTIHLRSEKERVEWEQKQEEVLAQEHLFDAPLKPIDFPEARFVVKWRCRNAKCPTHTMSLLQWGIHELYRKVNGDRDKVIAKMWAELDAKKKDIFLFVGSLRGHQQTFSLMDSYSAVRTSQSELFNY